jgi:hypothetical protein
VDGLADLVGQLAGDGFDRGGDPPGPGRAEHDRAPDLGLAERSGAERAGGDVVGYPDGGQHRPAVPAADEGLELFEIHAAPVPCAIRMGT